MDCPPGQNKVVIEESYWRFDCIYKPCQGVQLMAIEKQIQLAVRAGLERYDHKGHERGRKYIFYVPNKVAIQCKCSGVYFSRRWRPLWSWIEYIGSVWNLRQPIDMISGSRVLSMRLCQRCFLKRAWKDIITPKKKKEEVFGEYETSKSN